LLGVEATSGQSGTTGWRLHRQGEPRWGAPSAASGTAGGTLVKRVGPNGDTWIAKWRDGGRQVQRGLGFVQSKKDPDGVTRAEAEAALGKLREHVAIERAAEREAEAKRALEDRRRTLAHVGEALIAAKRAAGRKPSTIEAYSYWLRIHIVDYFGPTPVYDYARGRPRLLGGT